MKTRIVCLTLFCMSLFPAAGFAQDDETAQGIPMGIFRLKPEARILGAYDKQQGSEGDFYTEAQAAFDIRNADAVMDVGGSGYYGYRAYDKHSEANGDFYGFGAGISTHDSPLKLGVSGYRSKTLDYDVHVKNGSGSDLGAFLTSSESTRTSVKVNAGYNKQVSDKSALMPGYEGMYYKQTFASQPDAEWHEHTASLKYGYGLSSRILLNLMGSYDKQFSSEENGSVTEASLGAESRNLDKISWNALLGVAFADYETSGTDQGVVGSLKLRWQATDKVSAYAFGESRYQPGYGGSGALQAYRAGYGGNWSILDQLRFGVQMLHDRQKGIQSGVVRALHAISGRLEYDIGRSLALSVDGRYIIEEQGMNRATVSCSAVYHF